MSASSLAGQRVVLVGGTSGIGLGVAAAALAEGAQVVVASSQAAHVEAAVKQLGVGASGSVVDVGDEASVARMFDEIGAFDHLTYSAGDWGPGMGSTARDLDLATAKAGFDVRFWGALTVVKYACRSISPAGSITLTDGMLAHRPRKGALVATAMLGGIEHLVRSLAVDLAPVRVNGVCPGLIHTERNGRMSEAAVTAFTARLPLPRMGDPAEVAEAYLYLMRGGYTTGQVLRVDGGGSAV